jgi:hypothetical protein
VVGGDLIQTSRRCKNSLFMNLVNNTSIDIALMNGLATALRPVLYTWSNVHFHFHFNANANATAAAAINKSITLEFHVLLCG